MPLDIRSDRSGPAGVLSNLRKREFTFQGRTCASMEGLLQSMKLPDLDYQVKVCGMAGMDAKSYGMLHGSGWKRRGRLHWDGVVYEREGDEYQQFLKSAYAAMMRQSVEFRAALVSTEGSELTHSVGHDDMYQTVLTEAEFCGILTDLRELLLKS